MAKQFNNLAGWVRDVRNAIAAGDAIIDDVTDILLDLTEDGGDGASEMDDTDNATDGVEIEMDGAERDVRQQVLPGTGRPVAGRSSYGAAASRLDSAVDLLAGDERAQAIAELDKLRVHAMGAPVVKGGKLAKKAR